MQVKIGSQLYDTGIGYFSYPLYQKIRDIKELNYLKGFPNLTGANFSGSGLNDKGLEILSQITRMENLCLQETDITNDGLKHLAPLKQLQYLRLKDNQQLTNDCIPHLLAIEKLKELQIHETSITQEGLDQLAQKQTLALIVLDVWDGNYTYEGLLAFSAKLPGCTVLAKGRGEFLDGRFDGTWR